MLPAKLAALLPEVNLQPHQQSLANEAAKEPVRKLLMWGLGSGKTLGSLAAAEARKEPYTAVVPAALRANYRHERQKWTDKKTPADVLSYSELALGKQAPLNKSLVFDEAQRLRNPESQAAQRAQALSDQANQVLLLSGTPLVNRPGDLAVPLSLLTNKRITPDEFENRYVQSRTAYPNLLARVLNVSSGEEEDIHRREELKSLLKGHVDYYAPSKTVVPVSREEHAVDMSLEQTRLLNAMYDKLPFYLRWKLKQQYGMTSTELSRLQHFLSGPRQVGLSTLPFRRDKDAYKAFNQSPKLQKAFSLLQEELKDPRKKALIFSNFLEAGLTPYAAALAKAKVPHAIFHGGLNDRDRQRIINDYNANKLRAVLLGPSGTEGLSFKGTQLVQQLDPHFTAVRPQQAQGRALRFDSHEGLPEELQHVKVQRFISRLPPGLASRWLARLLWRKPKSQPATDDYLQAMSQRKDQLNQKFVDVLKEVGSR